MLLKLEYRQKQKGIVWKILCYKEDSWLWCSMNECKLFDKCGGIRFEYREICTSLNYGSGLINFSYAPFEI